ncbi:MAG: phenylalanine--tRNA ligase subunit beta [Nanobdellota archaeon]
MPTIKLNRKVFEELVGKELPEEKLRERISMLGTDLESMDKDEIHVEVFPNRPDMLSEQGFARAFSSFIGVKKGLRKYEVKDSGEEVKIDSSVKEVRPYTACAIIKNLKLDDEKIREIIQIQEKLHVTYGRHRKKAAIGIYPFEKIKPPIHYKALKPEEVKFRPLEAEKEMTAKEILEEHPTGKEYAHLLEGKEKYPVFTDSEGKILSMPPVINSEAVGRVDENTHEIFIECSGHEYGVLSRCLNIIVTAMADMGGKIYSMKLGYGKETITPGLEPEKMDADVSYINKILGTELDEKEFKENLERMGIGYENGKALIPAYRADILHQVDLAEDIAISHGYENIREEIPAVATIAEESPISKKKNRIREILTGLSLIECKTYHIANKDSQTKMMEQEKEPVELKNALNEEYSILASWNLPSLMEVFKSNRQREYPQEIFSLGKVFSKDENEETGIKEEEHLTCALCGDKVDFTRIKQVLDFVMRMTGDEYRIEETEHNSFIKGRIGKIFINGEEKGIIGEVHPKVLSNWELEYPVSALEVKLW